tara:strand:+ start:774 stop:932 length:159 start_codon:yes stop_codon:yes gene_type:complete
LIFAPLFIKKKWNKKLLESRMSVILSSSYPIDAKGLKKQKTNMENQSFLKAH